MRGVPRAGGGSGERRAVGTPTRGCADAACSPDPATDGVGAARKVEGAGRAGRPSRPIGAQPAGYRAAEQPESTSTFRPAMWPARPTRAWSIAVAVFTDD